VKCGYLTVPEQRDKPQSGGIKLAVAIFKNPDATLSASGLPTIFLDGGPGGSALRDLGKLFISSDVQLLAPGGDLVLLDQRGVGYSQPALDCPEMGQAEQSNFNRDFVREFLLKAVQRCHDRLSASGVQLSAYNTIENAGDVHDLIHMLGYQRANLYGSSYGTLLALTVMRLYPGDLRGVVLDSVVPAQHNLYRDEPVVTQHAFNTLFKGCEASTICNNAYPQLGTVFDKLVYKWNAHKVRFQDNQGNALLMSGDDLIGVLYEALYDTEAIPLLPEVIWRASDGDYTALARLLGRLDGTSDTELGADPITRGMYYSVVCGEDMAFTSLEELKTAIQPVRFSLQSFLRDDVEYIAAVCNIWKEKPVPAAQNQPVVSSVPTLVLSGEYDPITPPSYGREAVQTLDHSFFFQFPGMGHGVVGARSCPAQIARDFLRDPSRRPGTGCIGDMSEPGFV
ncbi:MAG: alpha/beta fold hydrolase, partial [Ktedonobacteraceae bacterium]|nr:alpha/beta fold hydrolase [Ktedonobacteraceae bacterium]